MRADRMQETPQEMLKASENPPILPPWVTSLEELGDRWWVGHTRARFEKVFAWALLNRSTGYFLPMVERVRVSGGRKRRVMMPLFTSYVFFCGDEEDRYAALATNRLCQVIDVPDQEALVREMLALERALQHKVQLDPYPFAAIGQCCRITGGPFVGMEGTVVERTKPARLVLQVGILGQGASMEVDLDLLEPVD